MEKYDQISNADKWQATESCDKSYDGLFFYGVKTTGIFCRPSCNSKTPNQENVNYFDSVENAIQSGYRPCKRCQPDKIVYDPNSELIEGVIKILDININKEIDLNNISKQRGISTNHLRKLFKQYKQITLIQYINKMRIEKSVKLLEKSNKSIIDIAHLVGFKSLSQFYKCFKEQIGQSPNEYRKKKGDI